MPKLRDSISYGSPYGGEWLKTRDVDEGLAKALGLLQRLTTFERWATATLAVQVTGSAAVQDVCDDRDRARHAGAAEPTFDLAGLRARGVEVDDLAATALARFGPAACRSWASSGASPDWRRALYQLEWPRTDCATPVDWVAFVAAHQAHKDEARHSVDLSLATGYQRWVDPHTRAPLPFQDATHYPPFGTSSSDCRMHLVLALPGNTMLLDARLPFERADAAFCAYDAAMTAALGHALSAKHFRAKLSNQAGTGTYERKLTWSRS